MDPFDLYPDQAQAAFARKAAARKAAELRRAREEIALLRGALASHQAEDPDAPLTAAEIWYRAYRQINAAEERIQSARQPITRAHWVMVQECFAWARDALIGKVTP